VRGLLTDLIRAIPLGRLRLGLAVLLAVAASASSVALMGVSAWLISFAALLPPVLYLQAPAVGVRTFAISRGVFRYVERLVGHDVALRMQSGLRMRTYDSLARTTLIGARRGDLLTRVVADTEAVTDVVVRVLIPVASGLLVITGASVGIAVISPWAGLALFATTLLAGVVVPLLAQRATLAADHDAAPTRGELADAVREVARTAPDLVAYGAEHTSLARLLEEIGVDAADAVAFGDMHNDLGMLELVGRGYVMADADPCLLGRGFTRIGPNNEGAVGEQILRLLDA